MTGDQLEALAFRLAQRGDDLEPLADLWVASWQAVLPGIDFVARRIWFCANVRDIEAHGGSTICAFDGEDRLAGFILLESRERLSRADRCLADAVRLRRCFSAVGRSQAPLPHGPQSRRQCRQPPCPTFLRKNRLRALGSRHQPDVRPDDLADALAARSRLNLSARRNDTGNRRQAALDWLGGAAGCVRIVFPGALSISTGAVPDLAPGLGHTAPTYFVGSRDRNPTAIAAPRSSLPPCFSSAIMNAVSAKAALRTEVLARRGLVSQTEARAFASASCRCRRCLRGRKGRDGRLCLLVDQ